ncbi:MAG: PDZ domain-containing protein, partial [Bacteroidota bacterium]
FGYQPHWSPNSEKICYIDEKNDLYIMDVASGEEEKIDNFLWNQSHPGRTRYQVNWSPDSKWITYARGIENANNAIFLHQLETKETKQLTSGYYSDQSPAFSADGKYLFYQTQRNFSAAYSDMGDGTWIYPNSTMIGALALTKDAPGLLLPKNDELASENGPKKGKGKKDTTGVVVSVDWDDIESRLELLPIEAGNMGGLMPFEGKLLYVRFPNTGANGRGATIMAYDLKKREEKPVMKQVNGAQLTSDGKAILVASMGKYGIIKPMPGQKIEKPIPTDGLAMNLVPKEEWRQLFHDSWRRYRDFFYDPTMHKLDWDALREQYGSLIEDARTRWDVNTIMSGLAAELSAGHTYTRGGDVERVQPVSTGFLGIDWMQEDGVYKIKRIARPAAWDTEVRSPFDRPGVDIQVGDAILSVNGMKLDPKLDPYAAFEGLSGKVVSLSVSRSGKAEDAKTHVITCLSQGQESQLRNMEWIENNRKKVEELSDGQLGYVYMSNTSGLGQLQLVRMFYGQLDKKGYIIDERFNGGGQLADRFLELMQRPVVYNLHWRHGRDHTQPIKTNMGPMGMLINGWAGSGGDGLPWAFQELKAGPIVGERTLGILVGPATGHRLIDGGSITVPGARLYDNDGHWFWEGEGVSPDIEVWDDPAMLVKGRDPQLERVVQEVMKNLKANPPKMTPAPELEDRTAKGLGSRE